MASDTTATKPGETTRGKRKNPWLIMGVVAVVGLVAYAAIARPWEPKTAKLAVEIVSEGPLSQVLAVNGRVAAKEAVNVRSAVAGIAIVVQGDEGAEVKAGDTLLQLDPAQPQAQVDQAQAAYEAGVVRQQQAQANADRAQALGENATRSNREDAQLSLTAAINETARLRAALEQAKSQLGQYAIRAPLDGVVLARAVERGQLVDTQTALFTVADISQLIVETDVDEIYSSRIDDGLKALLRPAGDTVAQHGTVIFASPKVDPSTGGRAIKIAFDEAIDLPVGLTVNANIIVAETENAISVPRSAIVTQGAQSHIFVLENGVVVEREIGFSDWPAERVMVTSGLAIGDVVVSDATNVEAGQSAVAE
jgi:membrane fusion protein (multidrug efflux system)